MDQNQAQYEVFRHFLEFGSFDFNEVTFNDNLQQCLTSKNVKSTAKQAKIGP